MSLNKHILLIDNVTMLPIKHWDSIAACSDELFIDHGTATYRCRTAFARYHMKPFICYESEYRRRNCSNGVDVLKTFAKSKDRYVLLGHKEVDEILDRLEGKMND